MFAEQILRKHVAIIHVDSTMTHVQRKATNFLLFEAKKNYHAEEYKERVIVECRIPVSRICNAVGYTSKNREHLKTSLDELASMQVEWNLLKDKVPKEISFLNLRVLHGPPTFFHDGSLNFSFHKIMLDFVDTPDVYGIIDMELQSEFESKFSHAVYETGSRLVNLEKSRIIPLNPLKRMTGVGEKYKETGEFLRTVLNPAAEEVSDKANFFIKFNQIREGRNIVAFEVDAKAKNKSKISTLNIIDIDSPRKVIIERIKSTFGVIREEVLNNKILIHSDDYILEKIEYLEKLNKKMSNGLYPVPYFLSALKDDYKLASKKEENDNVNCKNPLSSKKIADWKEKGRRLISQLECIKRHVELGRISKEGIERLQEEEVKIKKELDLHYLEKPKEEVL